jgi:MoaA/NifB/PqqE/SkfB family radical SAM enzyme
MSLNPVIGRLPILILNPHSRCNCRCVMCDIWKGTDSTELSVAELEGHLRSIERLGVEWVVFSGGEPLMHSDLFRLCELLRRRRIHLTLLTTGLLLERNSRAIVDSFDDVIVSLDGPPEIHNQIRRVPLAFETLAAGVRALRVLRADFPITARSTVQRRNCNQLHATAHAARDLGLNSISFLAADLTSTAFNRPNGWTAPQVANVGLTADDVAALEGQIKALTEDPALSGFVAESPAKLRRIVDHFRVNLGIAEPAAPTCNAPWVSAVLEVDGTVRPCFFHPAYGKVEGSTTLLEIVNSPGAIEFRGRLDVAKDPTCQRCVCSLNWQG